MTTHELSEYLGVPVRVERIGIKWISRLTLEGVYLEDQAGKPMIEANHVSAGFKLLPLLQGKYVFTTVRLFGFNMHLQKERPDEKLNLQFLIDAFASRDTLREKSPIDLRLNSVLLRQGKVSYDVQSEKQTNGIFNAKHIDIQNISANISLKVFNADSINAHVKKLSFNEASGFALNRLSMNIIGNRDSTYIDQFEVRLPNSRLNIDKAAIQTSAIDGVTSLFNNAPLALSIAPSRLCLKDLAAFTPAFAYFSDTVQISAEASGVVNNIDLQHLTVRQANKMMFNGQMNLRGITDPKETYIFGKVNQMYVTPEGLSALANNFNKEQIQLPEPILNLGTIHFSGEISGFFDNLVAFGQFTSSVGSIETDILLGSDKTNNIAAFVRGHIASSNLAISDLFPEGNPYGNGRFDITIDAAKPANASFSGSIQANINEFDYKNYTYENILLSGNFQENGFDGTMEVNDENGYFFAEGLFENNKQNSVFNFTADLNHFRPDKLNLSQKYEEPEISFSLQADFTGNTFDNVEGTLRIDSLQILTKPSDFFLEKMEIEAVGHADDRRVNIASDLLNGEIVGAYSFETMVPSIINTFELYLPSLIKHARKRSQVKENNFSVYLTLHNTEALSNTMLLPVTIVKDATISGYYNNRYDKFRIEANLPQFRVAGSDFDSGYLIARNEEEKVDVQLKATQFNAKGTRNYIDLKADAVDNLINTTIHWANNKEQLFKADFAASVLFVEEEGERGKPELRTEISIHENPVFISDSTWLVHPASVTIQNGKIDIDNFIFTHADQFIHLDGIVSRNVQDTLQLKLQDIELSYIFDILNIPVLQFAGKATGDFVINDLYQSRILNTDLTVEDFAFNNTLLGKLNLYSEWDELQQGILMLGSIYKNDSTWTDVNGYIYPVKPKEGLSLHFDANDIDISFLHPFLDNVATGVKGRGFGHVHLFGSFKDITIEGDTYVKDAGLGIEFLNTYYTFSDSIHLTPNRIQANGVTVNDKYGNAARMDFTFNHSYFRDYNFLADIQTNKVLLYDHTERTSPIIYGKAFGTGTGRISGNDKVIDFDINMRNDANTSVGFNFMTSSASTAYDFITFIDPNSPDSIQGEADDNTHSRRASLADEGTEIRMNVQLDITPDAIIELIMDPIGGDKIKGRGTGSIQIQYGTKSDLRMYGGASIQEGNYNFSLQQILHRDFKIREGSTISFQGDPMNANLDINAIYSLTANVGDLDQGILRESDRANIPVNCVLNIEGALQSPLISFDIELPGSNEEIERQVRSLIDTDDQMTRQIVYLLVLQKFYTPEYIVNEYRTADFSAVASSAISTQVSNILNSMTDKVQIGTNIRTAQDGGFNENTEIEMLLSSQLLDNRLLFNGNFGYRNSMALQKNVFVGEFDLEYKLTPSGDIRLKAYNHANDMYYLKQSLTTQGVGIMFKRDFTNLYDLFHRKRRVQIPLKEEEKEKEKTEE
ncbi:translocation/assembly module TamB domain-containing protein [Parabacteroides sp. OttesenSCG-928-K15]|nr:translocation/assembly module TamB domain-containing protein [Parabacteroides sp. OttesenSCG-928-K15]